jgi:YcxB-like protein
MSDEPVVSATCSVSERDFVSAHYVHLRPRPLLKTSGWFLLLFLAAGLLVAAFRVGHSGSSYPPFLALVAAATYLALVFLVWRPWRLRRLYRQHAHPGRPFDFSAGSSAVELRSERGHTVIPWTDFRKWKEGKRVILLYHNDALFNIIPKACLTEEQLQVLREILAGSLRRVP